MWSFRDSYMKKLTYDARLTNMIARVSLFKGKEQLYTEQLPEVLEHLKRVAIIQSTESSNRIEGITLPSGRLEKLLRERLDPKNRSEAEIAGYREVLDQIHSSAKDIPLKPGVILQFHRDLTKLWTHSGGRWKGSNNEITETRPDGQIFVRFTPVDFSVTPEAVEELCKKFLVERDKGEIHELVLIAAFALDFLCIHPFADGNGRMVRLLTLLLLYQSGFIVGRYISIEKIVEDTKEQYYDTLYRSSQGWHDGEHDVRPWLEYFLTVMLMAYNRFEERVDMDRKPKKNWKSERVKAVIEHLLKEEFTLAEIEEKCPGVRRPTINKVLNDLKNHGKIECVELGRNARWKKLV